MIKETPSLGRVLAMALFTMSCIGLLMWMWLQFGGSVPLKPQSYRFKASFTEAALLVEQADVRISGLDVGKVVDKELDARRGRTIVTVEMDRKFAPVPKDTRAILRLKGLLGETFIELTPGHDSAGMLDDGDTLPRTAEQKAVQIDEIVRTFDKETRTAFQSWIRELATAIEKGRGEHLNDALGNLPDFVATGEDVLRVLDEEEPALRRLIRNSGRALGAVNRRRGELTELIRNANNTMGAFASQNEALAETIFVLPTFLDESRSTLLRLREFARDTRPLVRDLQPVADDLHPTLRDVRRLAPDLEDLFRDLDPLIRESKRNLPAAARFVRGAEPLFESLHVYLPELNPFLSMLNYYQPQVSDFIMNGGGSLSGTLPPVGNEGGRHYLRQYGVINTRGIGIERERPAYDRGNAYGAPNYFTRARQLGMFEAWDCKPTDGEQPEAEEDFPPCFVAPKSLWDGNKFARPDRGEAPVRPPPPGALGAEPAKP